MFDNTFSFVFVFALSFEQTIPLEQSIFSKTFNAHSLIKCVVLHFVPFDCQSAGLIAVRAVLPFAQTCCFIVDITMIFLFYRTISSCLKAKKVLIKIFNVNGQNFKSESQIQLDTQDGAPAKNMAT